MQYVMSNTKVIAFIKGKPYTIFSTDQKYSTLCQMLRDNEDESLIEEYVNKKIEVRKNISKMGLELNDEFKIFYKDKELPVDITEVLINFYNLYSNYDEEESFNALQKFAFNLLENPNYENISDLYSFLQKGNLPITDDGHFLAYKVVNSKFMDKHTGTMDNSIGKIVYMDRKKCDLDRNSACSTGLHFCSRSYINGFYSTGDKIIELKINPKDVTSIPIDYNQTKGRCCLYKVNKEIIPGDLDGKKIIKEEKAETSFFDKQIEKVKTKPVQNSFPEFTKVQRKQIRKGKGAPIKEVLIDAAGTKYKACSICKKVLSFDAFSKDKYNNTGHRSSCKLCDKASLHK